MKRFLALDPIQQRVFVLYRGNMMNSICPTNGFRTSLTKPEKANLAAFDEPSHRSNGVLNRYQWINAVLVIQIDHIDAEAFEARVTGADDVLGPSVRDFAAAAAEITEFRGYENLMASPGYGLAHKCLVVSPAVHVGRVKHGDAALDGVAYQFNSCLVVAGAIYTR